METVKRKIRTKIFTSSRIAQRSAYINFMKINDSHFFTLDMENERT